MKHFLCSFSLLFLFFSSFSQNQFTLSGYVKIAESSETLIGATVSIPALGKGTYTNEYGFYSLSVPPESGKIEIHYSYVGFARVVKTVDLAGDQTLDVGLGELETTLEEVEIVANSFEEQLKSTEMSVSTISMDEAKRLPAILGEVDIIKTLQLKPGVSSGGEGSSGIFVRGGGPDQNLVLLDGSVVYNPSHLFGFFSTFNSDAVKDVKLYKAGFPAQYSGRLSSVIDVHLNEGNRKKFSGKGGLGLIASRLTLEGPLQKDKGSFVVSGRRTYVDLFTRAINNSNSDNADFNPIPDYFFYDLNTKVNYDLGEKDQIFVSGYFGRDAFKFDNGDFDFNFIWGNTNANLRWTHLFNPRLFLNTTASFSDYKYEISNEFDIFSFSIGSEIRDGSLKADLSWLPNNRHTVKFGAMGTYHRFIIGRLEAGAEDSSFAFSAGNTFYATELGAYISDDWEVSERFKMHAGLRLSGFVQENTTYWGLEPRLSMRYSLSNKVSLKGSYAAMRQYLHLISGSGASLPTDIWYPSTENVAPESSHQVAGGISYLFGDGRFLLTNEVYYKWLYNQIDYRDGADLFVNDDLSREFVFGDGYSYGNELYLEKKKGKFTGWLGYTLSWSWRQFDGTWRTGDFVIDDAINNGERFPYRNDTRHDITIVGLYELSKRWSFSAAWEYRTGNAITLPIGRYAIQESAEAIPRIFPVYTSRNSFRMPAYHKLDLSVIWRFFPKWGESDITFSAYNAYNRRNPYFIYIETIVNENDVPIGYEARQVALFPIIPSITYNFKF